MQVKNLDLIGAILIVAINIGLAQLPGHPPIVWVVGIIFAVPFLFVLPGYTLTQVLFLFYNRSPAYTRNLMLHLSSKPGQPIGWADYIILSLGLSIVIDVLIGFILNMFSTGLQELSWSLSLGCSTTLFTLLAALLRRGDRSRVGSTSPQRILKPRITVYEGMLFGLAILIATGAIWLSIVRTSSVQASFSQFWMLPSNHANKSCIVRIGIHNYEQTTKRYIVTMALNGAPIETWSSVTLTPQAEWHQVVVLSPVNSGNMFIEARLYQLNGPTTVYKKVSLTFHVLNKKRELCAS